MSYRLCDGRVVPGITRDEVDAALAAFTYFGGEAGPSPEDAIAHALAAVQGVRERAASDEIAAERRRERAQLEGRVQRHMYPRLCPGCRRHPEACVCGRTIHDSNIDPGGLR
jgi:hypothetical protein